MTRWSRENVEKWLASLKSEEWVFSVDRNEETKRYEIVCTSPTRGKRVATFVYDINIDRRPYMEWFIKRFEKEFIIREGTN